jgi:hypothetical protein
MITAHDAVIAWNHGNPRKAYDILLALSAASPGEEWANSLLDASPPREMMASLISVAPSDTPGRYRILLNAPVD